MKNRPLGVTPYMWRKFLDHFKDGAQFWTSEDGDPCEVVILRSDDSLQVACTNFPYLNLIGKSVKPGFVTRERVGKEFYDAPYGQRQGMAWRLSDKQTPFPVHIIDPYEKVKP